MKEYSRRVTHPLLMLLGGVVLVASHVIFFNRLRHAGMSLAVVSGLAVLIIAKHLGVAGSLYTFIRRRLRSR